MCIVPLKKKKKKKNSKSFLRMQTNNHHVEFCLLNETQKTLVAL